MDMRIRLHAFNLFDIMSTHQIQNSDVGEFLTLFSTEDDTNTHL